MADVAVELDERAGVEQLLDPLAREQLPLRRAAARPPSRCRRGAPRRGARCSRASLPRRSCRALSAIAGSLAQPRVDSRHGAAARPLDDLAVRGRRAGRRSTTALRAPDRRRGRARARRARGRRGAALPVRDGRDDGARARAARAGRDDRARAQDAYYGTRRPASRARALGPAARRVRPDAARRRPAPTSSGSRRRRTRS